MTTKHCTGCDTTKDENEFRLMPRRNKDGDTLYYRYYRCDDCRRAMAREAYYYKAEPEADEDRPLKIIGSPWHPHLYPMDQALRHFGVFT